jgi:hypothetical protein
MPELWVPPSARTIRRAEDYQKTSHGQELAENRKDFTAQLLDLFYLTGGILDDWNRELQRIDELLKLGQAVELIPAGFPVIPGYYHLLRLNRNAPPSVTPITGPNGVFAVPTSKMLDKLREGDLQHRAAVEARRVRMENEIRADERSKARFRQERREELFGRLRSATETSISFNPEHRWSQNVAGRRGKRDN